MNGTTLRTGDQPRFVRNPAVDEGPWGPPASEVLSLEGHGLARREIASWPGYAPTPLRRLEGLAAALGLGRLWYKDEGKRFGLGSFKALGGPYGVYRILARRVAERTEEAEPDSAEIIAGTHREIVAGLTVSCTSTGNHGRAVAWGARLFGCRCVIFVPDWVSEGRTAAIAGHGARVERLAGGYDEGIRLVAERAQKEGWYLISDNSQVPGTEHVAGHVMHGYTVVVAEALEELGRRGERPPTHVFVPAGVGGLAAAVTGYLKGTLRDRGPVMIVVESEAADCVLQSVRAGRRVRLDGPLETMMGGLACREASPNAWEVLRRGAHFCLAISDEDSRRAMRLLADGRDGDPPIVVGESGAAATAGLLLAARHLEVRHAMGLKAMSRVLVIGTEGATDPEIYARIVGKRPDEVS
ncbi:MAG: diaminopropionate ammonia-lyase [Gemmatimonadota bacterium]